MSCPLAHLPGYNFAALLATILCCILFWVEFEFERVTRALKAGFYASLSLLL